MGAHDEPDGADQTEGVDARVDDSAEAADDDGVDAFDEFDFDSLDAPDNLGAPPRPMRRGAVATAFLGAGLALETIFYGEKRSEPALIQEASEPDPDADLVVFLDQDDPTQSWARVRDDGADES